MLLFIKFNST